MCSLVVGGGDDYVLAFSTSMFETIVTVVYTGSGDKWLIFISTLPTVPESLKNPCALTVNDTTYDGSEEKDFTDTINAMIDTKLNKITNAEEVAY